MLNPLVPNPQSSAAERDLRAADCALTVTEPEHQPGCLHVNYRASIELGKRKQLGDAGGPLSLRTAGRGEGDLDPSAESPHPAPTLSQALL
jgi:hypothetical protein